MGDDPAAGHSGGVRHRVRGGRLSAGRGSLPEFLNPVFYGSHEEESAVIAGVSSDGSAALSLAEGEADHGVHGHPTITIELKVNMGISSRYSNQRQ
ncbi:MAG: hypothetical protein R2839_00385 [Thermomicrobiales bacterium]